MAEKTVVLFVAVSMKNGIFHFAAHLAYRAEGSSFPDMRAGLDQAIGSDIAWSLNHDVGKDPHIFIDPDGAVLGIQNGAGFDACSLGRYEYFVHPADGPPDKFSRPWCYRPIREEFRLILSEPDPRDN